MHEELYRKRRILEYHAVDDEPLMRLQIYSQRHSGICFLEMTAQAYARRPIPFDAVADYSITMDSAKANGRPKRPPAA